MERRDHILLVEDDIRLASLIREYLQQQGLRVAIEQRGDRAVKRIVDEHPDLVVLDLMLPGRDGFEVCREVRPSFPGPILMLTARDEDVDQIVGLELGADDYVTKPVQPRVLLARIRALLRRVQSQSAEPKAQQPQEQVNTLTFGKLKIDRASRDVLLGEKAIDLTTNEFELLWLLGLHAGEILSRNVILSTVRGIGYDGLDRSVDINISRLRKKLGDTPAQPSRIKTVRGRGYLFVADAWE